MRVKHVIVMAAVIHFFPAAGRAVESVLPRPVVAHAKVSLVETSSADYSKLGFSIYKATLWTPEGKWDRRRPHALQMRYKRSLSKQTLVDSVVESIREQNIADAATFERWEAMLEETLPAVEKNDELVGVAVPNKPTQLYFNGTLIASIRDRAFSDAFFNVWLGDTAPPDLRDALLGFE